MTRAEQDLPIAAALSAEMQARTKRENAGPTDRELLELAAKAAGIKGIKWNSNYPGGWLDGYGAPSTWWNPLTDDGDALRLAVKLHLWFRPMAFLHAPSHEVDVYLGGDGKLATERANGDPFAATRRAIVRAAAEIARATGA